MALDDRIRLVPAADRWELCVLAASLALPPRAGEVAGLLVRDVDFVRRRLRFRTRVGGDDFTRGKTEFDVPFPLELAPLFRAMQGGRAEGPLLRTRRHLDRGAAGGFADHASLRAAYNQWLAKLPAAREATPADPKDAFREFLVRHGGLSPDGLKKAFDALQRRAFCQVKFRLHDLRHAATEGMINAGVSHLAARYFTSHACDDVLNTYASINIDREAKKYFDGIQSLLAAIASRSRELGLTASAAAV